MSNELKTPLQIERDARFQRVQSALLVLHTSGHTVKRVDYETGEIVFNVAEPNPVMEKMLALIHQGKPIEAIKLHREAYGSGLADAKNVVDRVRGLAPA